MPGIQNITAPTWEMLQNLSNSSSYPEFAGKVSHEIYGGLLYFVILWVVLYVLYVKLNDYKDQPLINMMYACTAVSLLALILRAIDLAEYGLPYGLLTDFQMWIFPVLAIVLAGANWAIKDRY